MSLIKSPFKEKKPENEGFSKVYETLFEEEHSSSAQLYDVDKTVLSLGRSQCDIFSEFFINPENNIAYMIGNIKNREIHIPYPYQESEKLKQGLVEIDFQRIFAYSELKDGRAVLTGNLKSNFISNDVLKIVNGEIPQIVPNELFIDGKILRDIEQRNINKVLRSHKRYVSKLEIVSDPKLDKKLAEIYPKLNDYVKKYCNNNQEIRKELININQERTREIAYSLFSKPQRSWLDKLLGD